MRQRDSGAQRALRVQPLPPRPRVAQHQPQKAQPEQNLCRGERSWGNLSGDRRPLQMQRRQTKRQQPGRWFAAPAPRAH